MRQCSGAIRGGARSVQAISRSCQRRLGALDAVFLTAENVDSALVERARAFVESVPQAHQLDFKLIEPLLFGTMDATQCNCYHAEHGYVEIDRGPAAAPAPGKRRTDYPPRS